MPKHWNWRQRSVAMVAWASFLGACLATMLFFAAFDPQIIAAASHVQVLEDVSATALYSIGFFFFWAITAVSSGVTAWLIRTERRKAQFPTGTSES